jgi:hypothetical protein
MNKFVDSVLYTFIIVSLQVLELISMYMLPNLAGFMPSNDICSIDLGRETLSRTHIFDFIGVYFISFLVAASALDLVVDYSNKVIKDLVSQPFGSQLFMCC